MNRSSASCAVFIPAPDQNAFDDRSPKTAPDRPVKIVLLNCSLSVPDVKSVMVSLFVVALGVVSKMNQSMPVPPVSVSLPAPPRS